jgi:hypothetical protein
MPYIKQEDRNEITFTASDGSYQSVPEKGLYLDRIETAGELQYAMAVMFKSYLERKGLNYQHCNDILGALSGAQMEFYRRHVAKYEDSCIERNGDV